MEMVLQFLGGYGVFLQNWAEHTQTIVFAGAMWLAIVAHLFWTKHAKLTGNSHQTGVGCGDYRVMKSLVIFGGPAGLTMGLPYYWLAMQLPGQLREYVFGFVFIQFVTGVVQAFLLFVYAISIHDWKETVVRFKAHLSGCGWVTGTGPFWFLYWLQQIRALGWLKRVRDIETVALYILGIVTLVVPVVCVVASIIAMKVIVPTIHEIELPHGLPEL